MLIVSAFSLAQEAYANLWKQFVDALWNSTDSLWILPCCSEDKPQAPATNTTSERPATLDHQWLSPASQERQKAVSEVIEDLLLSRLGKVKLGERHRQADYDQWLLKSTDPPAETWHHTPNVAPLLAHSIPSMEEWLGWKAMLEKVHSMGDAYWLYHPPAETGGSTGADTSATMEY